MSRRRELLAPGLRSPISRFCIIFAAALSICQPLARSDTPVTVGGSFTLTAPDGTTVTDETYRGKWLLVFFGYTSCPDICPTTLYEIAAVLDELGLDAAKLQPIFIKAASFMRGLFYARPKPVACLASKQQNMIRVNELSEFVNVQTMGNLERLYLGIPEALDEATAWTPPPLG